MTTTTTPAKEAAYALAVETAEYRAAIAEARRSGPRSRCGTHSRHHRGERRQVRLMRPPHPTEIAYWQFLHRIATANRPSEPRT